MTSIAIATSAAALADRLDINIPGALREVEEFRSKDWPEVHKRRQRVAFQRPHIATSLEYYLNPTKGLGLGRCITLCNKSTWIYDAHHRHIDTAFDAVYEEWNMLRSTEEPYEDRFAASRVKCTADLTVEQLIPNHLMLCDLIEKKMDQPVNDKREQLSWGGKAFFDWREIHSTLNPTCKAAFILMDRDDLMVLLVLTGSNASLHTDGDIDFKDCLEHVVEQPQPNVARMHLKHAIRFMHTLDAREQNVNHKLAILNETRRNACKESFYHGAVSDVERAKWSGLEYVGSDSRTILKKHLQTTK